MRGFRNSLQIKNTRNSDELPFQVGLTGWYEGENFHRLFYMLQN